MSFVRGQTNQVGLALATSANGTARNGAALAMNRVEPGCLAVECVSQITTASVVATFKIQVSMDATTWFDLKNLPQTATTNTAAGTGSPVETDLAIEIPRAASAYMYLRAVATLSGASTAAADKTQVTYRFLRQGLL